MAKNKSEVELMNLVVSHLERIEVKVDKLDERLDSSEKIQIKQEANLSAHMKRSDLLEASQDELRDAIKPILKVYTIAWGITKIIAALGVLAGLAKIFI
jgi:hypothetical protein